MQSLAEGVEMWLHATTVCVTLFVDLCRSAHLSVQVEVGNNLTLDNSRPADILVGNWDRGEPAAFDFTVSSPLSPAILSEASANTGAAARSAEEHKHRAKCEVC